VSRRTYSPGKKGRGFSFAQGGGETLLNEAPRKKREEESSFFILVKGGLLSERERTLGGGKEEGEKLFPIAGEGREKKEAIVGRRKERGSKMRKKEGGAHCLHQLRGSEISTASEFRGGGVLNPSREKREKGSTSVFQRWGEDSAKSRGGGEI